MKRLVRLASIFLPLISLIALVVVFNLYSPAEIGPLGVLLVFGLLYLFWASLLFLLLHGGVAIAEKFIGHRRLIYVKRWQMEVKKAYYVASVVAFAPVLLLALNSVGQFKVQDAILVAALICIGVLFILKKS